MNQTALSPVEIAACVLFGIGIAALAFAFCWWVTKLVREHNETKRARGVAIADFFVELRAGRPEALERAQREIGH